MGAIVETSSGKIEGLQGEGLCVFKGIPFASPPVGRLRFQAPRKPEPWEGVRDATKYGPSAPQDTMVGMEVGPQNEDCLYLNVWTPAADGQKRPVMVWIHGGGFMGGSGSQEMYEASNLARNGNCVVVTTNYRIGALGFMFLADVMGKDFPCTANAGLLDQIAALQWVKENISRFGGDPSNVTIFGESAGGMSVSTLLGTPAARGLFHKAIPQSGATHHACIRADAHRVSERFLEEAGIRPDQPEKLYELTGEDFRKIQRRCVGITINQNVKDRLPLGGMVFVPCVDGTVLPDQPLDAIRNGLSAEVPVMTGTNLDEWMFFIQFTEMTKKKMDEEGLLKVVQKRSQGTPELAKKIVAAYRKSRPEAKPVDIYCAFESDRIFRIPALRLVEGHAKHQKDTYLYLFTWASPMMNGALKSCHALEIPFVFGNTDGGFGRMFTGGGDSTKALSASMQKVWVEFARTGRPGVPGWLPYDPVRCPVWEFNGTERLLENPMADETAVWDGIL